MFQFRIADVCTLSAADWEIGSNLSGEKDYFSLSEERSEKETHESVPAYDTVESSKNLSLYCTHKDDDSKFQVISKTDDCEEDENLSCRNLKSVLESDWYASNECCLVSGKGTEQDYEDCEKVIPARNEFNPSVNLPVIYEVCSLAKMPHCPKLKQDWNSKNPSSKTSKSAENALDSSVEVLSDMSENGTKKNLEGEHCDLLSEEAAVLRHVSNSTMPVGYDQSKYHDDSTNDKLKTGLDEVDLEETVPVAYEDCTVGEYEIHVRGERFVIDLGESDLEESDLGESTSDEESLEVYQQVITEEDLFEKCEALRLQFEELDEEMRNEISPLLDDLIADVNELINRREQRALDEEEQFFSVDELDSRSC